MSESIKQDTPQKPFRVAVSIPAGDSVKTGFAYDLANMISATVLVRDDVDIRIHVTRQTILPQSRTDLVMMALQHDYTHVLFLDTDMRFPRNTLLHLLARDGYVVGANYTTRKYPVRPVTFANDENADERVYTAEDAEGVEEVASLGFGCVLIDLDVFKALPRPWFEMPWDAAARNYTGEDVYFCRKVRDELGLPILIDHGLSHHISHIGEWEYRHSHARALREEASEQTPAEPLIVVPDGD